MPHLLVIGGSDAGVSAALRAREMSPVFEVTVLVADEFPNYSICGLPFYLSGEVPDWRSLAHRTLEELRGTGVNFLLKHRATAIDHLRRRVTVSTSDESMSLSFDRLVIATGAEPIRPPIAGLDSPGVFYLHSMDDSFRLQRHLTSTRPESAVIVGAGYIGLEMADAARNECHRRW